MSKQYNLTLRLNDSDSARYKSSKLVYYSWTESEKKTGLLTQPFACKAGDEICLFLEHTDDLLQGETPQLRATFQRLHGETYSPFSEADTKYLARASGVTGQRDGTGAWQFLDADGQPFEVVNAGPEFTFTVRIQASGQTWVVDPEMNVDGPDTRC